MLITPRTVLFVFINICVEVFMATELEVFSGTQQLSAREDSIVYLLMFTKCTSISDYMRCSSVSHQSNMPLAM